MTQRGGTHDTARLVRITASIRESANEEEKVSLKVITDYEGMNRNTNQLLSEFAGKQDAPGPA